MPGLFTFHAVYLIATFVAIRHGDVVMDWLAGGYNAGIDWLDDRIEKSVNGNQ